MATQKISTLISFTYFTIWWYLIKMPFFQKKWFEPYIKGKPLMRIKFTGSWFDNKNWLTIRAF